MKEPKYKRCRLSELQYAFEMRANGYSMQHIGDKLGRSKSSVSDWINHHKPRFAKGDAPWKAMSAIGKARCVYEQMKVRKKLKKRGHIRSVVTREYIINRLGDGDTPEHISATMVGKLERRVCFKTIYSFVKKERGLKKHLREKGKKRRQKVPARKHKTREGAPTKRSIHIRSEAVNNRKEFGHVEGDLIVGKRGGGREVILSLIERVSRRKWFILIPNRKATTVLAYLRGFLGNFPAGTFKTLTLDNGSEFAYSELIKLEKAMNQLLLYYADPYCSFQKGAIERANRDLRRYYPKGTDFATVNKKDIKKATTKINNTAMKLHNWRTPEEVFNAYLKKDLEIVALVA
jgi:IS30 family transposase